MLWTDRPDRAASVTPLPACLRGCRYGAFRWRQRAAALTHRWYALTTPVIRDPAPVVTRGRHRPVPHGDSTGVVVRQWIPGAAGQTPPARRRSSSPRRGAPPPGTCPWYAALT